jgi:hypothetical protein
VTCFYCWHALKSALFADSGLILLQLVFIVFTGEAWGYLGSRRFLYELDLQSDAVSGLNNSLIDMVVFFSW